jgi:hypothetical protein
VAHAKGRELARSAAVFVREALREDASQGGAMLG